MTGIILQWYWMLQIKTALLLFIIAVVVIGVYFLMDIRLRFKFNMLKGICINLCLLSLGMLLCYTKNITHQNNWLGRYYKSEDLLVATLNEPLVEKQNSYKAEAIVLGIIKEKSVLNANGRINIYFKKDTSLHVNFGDRIIFRKTLQPIKNTGNPGGFDYRRYALFNKITHTLYLTKNDFEIIQPATTTGLQWFVFKLRAKILTIIKKYIPQKREQGLAEALLIGYKEDLDKSLLRSYSNTGVVHVIAVSGMHLALIYWMLDVLLRPLRKAKRTKWLHPVLVLAVLWLFTLLTGLAPSIVRAAVMFTFITIGKTINRNASIYNTLAASAFVLLCYNPFWLWDVGFQLSYAAVLSIVLFFKPVYHWLSIKNKIQNEIWKLIAVTIAAQILTMPFVVYYFHQFPLYFILTNLIAVPLSSAILIGCIILIIVSPLKIVAVYVGKILYGMIWFLNAYIEQNEKLPSALWEGLQINVVQVVLLFAIICGIAVWLLYKNKQALWLSLFATIFFAAIRVSSFYTSSQQQKLVVYNDAKKTAIELIEGRSFKLMGDSVFLNEAASNYPVLKPSHTVQRIRHSTEDFLPGNTAIFNGKKFFWVNRTVHKNIVALTDTIDYLILSDNPKLYMNSFTKLVYPRQVVITATVPAYKAGYWKKDCDSLGIPCYDIKEQGAFVVNF